MPNKFDILFFIIKFLLLINVNIKTKNLKISNNKPTLTMWLRKLKRGKQMEFKFEDSTLLEHKDNAVKDSNTYMIISKAPQVEDVDLQNVIQIIDESGEEVSCTYDKFVEIFDEQGLAGFIM